MATIDLQAPIKDLQIEQGASVIIPYNVTRNGASFGMPSFDLRLQVRKTYSNPTVLINCTLPNGKLVWVDQAAGKFELRLDPEDTINIKFPVGDDELECVYDLELISPTGIVYKGCKGTLVIYREVTR